MSKQSAWKPLRTQKWPALTAISNTVDTASQTAKTTFTTAKTALNALQGFNSALSKKLTYLDMLREAGENLAEQLDKGNIHQLSVSPWTEGVGSGSGASRSLSVQRCIQAMADSVHDAGDTDRPTITQTVDSLAVIAAAPSLHEFEKVLKGLEKLLPNTGLSSIARRVEREVRQAVQRYTLPKASTPPDWTKHSLTETFPALKAAKDSIKSLAAMADGHSTENITQQMEALITAKENQLTEQAAALSSAIKAFGGGKSSNVWILSQQAASSDQAAETLRRIALPPEAQALNFACGVWWIAPNPLLKPIMTMASDA